MATKVKTAVSTSPPEFTHLVVRPFHANGIDLGRGELVDTSTWPVRRPQTLSTTRYLKPADPTTVPVTCDCGRLWADEEWPLRHECETAASAPASSPSAPTSEEE